MLDRYLPELKEIGLSNSKLNSIETWFGNLKKKISLNPMSDSAQVLGKMLWKTSFCLVEILWRFRSKRPTRVVRRHIEETLWDFGTKCRWKPYQKAGKILSEFQVRCSPNSAQTSIEILRIILKSEIEMVWNL